MKINEALILKQSRDQHGEVLGDLVAEQRIAAAKKALAQHKETERARAGLLAELENIEARLPRLEPLKTKMDTAYATWLQACHELEALRVTNEASCHELREKINKMDRIRAQSGFPARVEDWAKSDLHQEDVAKESLGDGYLRKQMNRERHSPG